MPLGVTTFAKGIVAGAMVIVGVGLAALQDGSPVRPTSDEGIVLASSSAAAMTDCGLTVPVQGVDQRALVDTFADARSEGRRHDAIDIMAPLGTPVLSASSGRVEKLFKSVAGGNTVYVRSPDGATIYYYAHLDRYAADLHEGRSVSRGTPLGTVGFSGNANPAAPHLHFAITALAAGRKWWEKGRDLNPYPILSECRN